MIQYVFSGQLNTKSTYFCTEIGKKHYVNYVFADENFDMLSATIPHRL